MMLPSVMMLAHVMMLPRVMALADVMVLANVVVLAIFWSVSVSNGMEVDKVASMVVDKVVN